MKQLSLNAGRQAGGPQQWQRAGRQCGAADAVAPRAAAAMLPLRTPALLGPAAGRSPPDVRRTLQVARAAATVAGAASEWAAPETSQDLLDDVDFESLGVDPLLLVRGMRAPWPTRRMLAPPPPPPAPPQWVHGAPAHAIGSSPFLLP
jgi:hypothetical protein